MTHPYSEDIVEEVALAIGKKYWFAPTYTDDQARFILDLLHERGVLIGSEQVQNKYSVEPIALSDLKERYPDLVSQIQAEERERAAVLSDNATARFKMHRGPELTKAEDLILQGRILMAKEIAAAIRSLPPKKAGA